MNKEGMEHIKILHIRPVKRQFYSGKKAELPSVVIAECEDGRWITVPVKWDEVPQEETFEDTIVISGKVEGTSLKASAELSKMSFVLSDSQNAGHGIPARKGEFLPINRIRLLPGSCYARMQQNMVQFLLHTDDDQMLYNFRTVAGIDTKGAAPMTGWDDSSCKLKGHTTGHYLSGLALGWAATGNPDFLRKIDYMVRELAFCQEALGKQTGCHAGFLSAYSEEQFDLLEQYTKYPDIWAPYYTLDKIMSGLYDCHTLTGNQQAKQILMKMGDWVYERLSRLPKAQRDRMWSMYIAGEFGGMPGTMVKLYRLSGEEKHRKAAFFFLNEKLFYPMEENCDTLEDMHANQHIPQIMGAMELYQLTGEEQYWKIGKNFWDIVTEGHTYCIGGTGETELFHRAHTTCSYLTENAAESCASYNLLRLTGQLFPYLEDGKIMDYYENTLCNHIMASGSHTCDGGTTYFMPQNPGGQKEYSTTENTCCHGTGMESRFRFMEHIFFQDTEVLYINLLIPCRLTAQAGAPDIRAKSVLEIHQEQEGVFYITCREEMTKKLAVRIPGWAEEAFEVISSCQKTVEGKKKRGYFFLEKTLKAGEEIRLRLPVKPTLHTDQSDSKYAYLTCGPYIMAALSHKKEFLPAPCLQKLRKQKDPLHFTDGSLEYIPFWQVDQEAYHIYFRSPL